MLKRCIMCLLLFAAVFSFAACGKSEAQNENTVTEFDFVPDYVELEAKEVINRVISHQSENSFSIAWLSDMHVGYQYKEKDWAYDESSVIEAGMALHEMNKVSPFDAIVLGGDLANGGPTSTRENGISEIDDATKYMTPATLYTPTLYLMGNHDDAPYRSTDERLSRTDTFTRLGRKNVLSGAITNELDPGCNYGYLDFENRKMRIIYLDTHDKNGWESTEGIDGTSNPDFLNTCNVSAKQLSWLANKALDFSDKEKPNSWGIIVVSHTQLDIYTGVNIYTDLDSGKTYEYNTDNVITILEAYLTESSGEITLNGETAYYDFSKQKDKAELYCCINGHRHCLENRLYGELGILGITCPNVRDGRERESDDGVTYTKVPGTADSTAFNVITVDRKNRVIYADNYGAGYDRKWNMVNYFGENNLVPTATVVNGTEIYNGLGYKNNSRISSLEEFPDYEGYVSTGIIKWRDEPGEFSELKPIYVKGVNMDTSLPYVRIGLIRNVNDEGMEMRAIIKGGEDTVWDNYFEIEELGYQYYRLTPIESAIDSWYHIRYFMMSFQGSGENLVITVDTPITW